MAIENESNQMVLFLNLSDLLLRNQGRKDWKSHSQPLMKDSSKSSGFGILFRNRMDSFSLIHTRGRLWKKKEEFIFFLLSLRSRV